MKVVSSYSPYIHVLDGRLRIKIPAVKGHPFHASQVEDNLREMDGITHVQANPTTGNVLILFAPDVISYEQIIESLIGFGFLRSEPAPRGRTAHLLINQDVRDLAHQAAEAFARQVVKSVTKIAIERLIIALI
jgi:copper chaperone CopZ